MTTLFLLDCAVKATLVLALAILAALASRRASASIRYALWTCVLCALLILPLASWVLPRQTVQINATVPAPFTVQPSVSVVVHGGRSSSRAVPESLPLMIWMVGALLMILRVAVGHWRVRSLFGSAAEIRDPRWIELALETAARIRLRRKIVLRRSPSTDVPLSYGLFRATILLPFDCDTWSNQRRAIVLAHEMIHVRRLDCIWGLGAQLALSVHWFNPLAWFAAAQFRKEQERSCDDAVVATGTAGTLYAEHLLDVARDIALPEQALGMAEKFDLEGRIHALLDPIRNRAAASRKLCAAMFIVSIALIVPLAVVRAQSAKGSVAGLVSDPSGAVIPGATISLKNMAGSNEEVVRSNAVGQYKLPDIPAGDYLLKVSVPGFASYQKTLAIIDGATASLNVNLAVGEIMEAVTVTGTRARPATASAVVPQRIRVGGNVQPIKLISKVNPDYPADAQADGVEGTVLLRAVVSKDGSLLSIKSISTGIDPRLVSAAKAAVPLWRYQPALLNGEPVEVITTIDVTFRLN